MSTEGRRLSRSGFFVVLPPLIDISLFLASYIHSHSRCAISLHHEAHLASRARGQSLTCLRGYTTMGNFMTSMPLRLDTATLHFIFRQMIFRPHRCQVLSAGVHRLLDTLPVEATQSRTRRDATTTPGTPSQPARLRYWKLCHACSTC